MADETKVVNESGRSKLCVQFTHTDADGLGCALFQHYSLEYETQVHYCAAGQHDPDNKILEYFKNSDNPIPHMILITDIGITDETATTLEQIRDYAKENLNHEMKLLLVDHHPTNTLGQRHDWCHVYTHDSPTGTPIAACQAMFVPQVGLLETIDPKYREILRALLTKIGRYDTWEWKRNPSETMDEEYFNIVIKERGIENTLDEIVNNITCDVGDNGNITCTFSWSPESLKIIQNYIKDRNDVLNKIMENVVITDFCEYKMALMFPDSKYFNESMTAVYEVHKDVDIVCGLLPEKREVSLRSNRTDLNLGRLANRLYEGGGHPQAAGAHLSTEDFIELLSQYYYGRDIEEEEKKSENDDSEPKYSLDSAMTEISNLMNHCKYTRLNGNTGILFQNLVREHVNPVLHNIIVNCDEDVIIPVMSLVRGMIDQYYRLSDVIKDDIDFDYPSITDYLNEFYLTIRYEDENGNEITEDGELINDVIPEAEVDDDEMEKEDYIDDDDTDDSTSDTKSNPVPEDGILYEDLFGSVGVDDPDNEGKLE